MNRMIEWHQFLLEHTALHTILRKMCSYVDKKLSPMSLKPWTKNWYKEYSWTDKQQEAFKVWMIDYLYTNNDARKTIMNTNIKNKRLITNTVDWFIFQYGWKVKYAF